MKITIHKYKKQIIYSILIIFQMLVCLYFASQKNSFYCDEPWSYGLANSQKYAFIDKISFDMFDEYGWVTKDWFNNYVIVDKNNPLSFSQAYHNQELDVHPPFYYFLLHIASLFTRHLSKWPGIILNLIILIGFDFVFFYVAKSIFRDKVKAVLALVLFSLSPAGLSDILYTRMYFLLTLLVMCYFAIHVHIIKHNSIISGKDAFLLFLCVVCGGLTHYYFYIFAFFTSFAFGISLLWRKKIRNAFLYAAYLLSGFVFNLIFFRATIDHVFYRNRGKEVLEKIGDGQTFWMDLYLKYVNKYMYGEYLYVTIFALLVIIIYRIVASKQRIKWLKYFIKEKPYLNKKNILITFAFYVYITFAIIIVRVSWPVHRFVFPTYPFVAIITLILLNAIYELARIKKQAYNIISAFVICAFVILSVKRQDIDFLYPEYPDAVEALKETEGYDVLVYFSPIQCEEYYTSFHVRLIYDEFSLFDENDIPYLNYRLEHRKTKDPFVIAIPRYMSNKHEMLARIYAALGIYGSYDLVHFYRGYDYFVIR